MALGSFPAPAPRACVPALAPRAFGATPPRSSARDQPQGVIAFSSLAPRGWDVYVLDVKSRRSRRLTDHAALDYNAAFAPGGKQVAFVSERTGHPDLYVVGLDGTDLKRLTSSDMQTTVVVQIAFVHKGKSLESAFTVTQRNRLHVTDVNPALQLPWPK